jgi:tetratricopeptide (TPR) repeat protein
MKIWCRVAMLVLSLVSFAAVAQDNPLELGTEEFQKGNYKGALEDFAEAERTQPPNAEIENVLGITRTKLGLLAEANTNYARAIQIDPKLIAPRKNLGFNYLTLKEYAQAEEQFTRALKLDAADPFVHYYLAILYLNTDRAPEAAALLGFIQPLLKNDVETSFLMAKACLRVGHDSDAIGIADELEQSSQLTVKQEYELAILFHEKRMYAAATDRFRKIAEMTPESWIGKYNLAVALINDERKDEAIRLLLTISNERPSDASVLSLLGFVYERQAQIPQAIEAYGRAVEADPQNPDLYLDYTRLLMDSDRYQEATLILDSGLKHTPDTYALNLRLGTVLMMEGKYAEARSSINTAVTAHPEIGLGYVALAQTYLKQGDTGDARNVLDSARQRLAPDFMLTLYSGIIASEVGDCQSAVNTLMAAEKLQEDAVEPHYELGKCFFELNQLKKAQGEFERAVSIDPQHTKAYYQLSRLYVRLGQPEKARQMADRTRELREAEQQRAIQEQTARVGQFELMK